MPDELPKIASNLICSLEIIEQNGDIYTLIISHHGRTCRLTFNPENREMKFLSDNALCSELIKNIYQLRKILHNKRKKSFYVGFCLKFVLKNNKKVIAFNDRSKLIVLDNRQNGGLSYPKEFYPPDCPVFYTDGSHQPQKKQSAAAVIVKHPSGLLNLYTRQIPEIGSTQSELIAALYAAELAANLAKFRIATDSRYVIKGLTEWIHNWKLNNWQTAQGTPVKNIENWQAFDRLTKHKIIEFQWIKGHSEHLENSLCDHYAKEAAAHRSISTNELQKP